MGPTPVSRYSFFFSSTQLTEANIIIIKKKTERPTQENKIKEKKKKKHKQPTPTQEKKKKKKSQKMVKSYSCGSPICV